MTLRKATPAEAKKAWESMTDPSLNKVMEVLEHNGIAISKATLQRWQAKGFPEVKSGRGSAKEAREQRIEDVTKEVTKTAGTEQEAKDRRTELLDAETTTIQLKEMAIREILIAQIVLAEQLSKNASTIATLAPGIAVRAIGILAEATQSTTIIIPPADDTPAGNGDDAKVVNGRVLPEKSPSQQAIEAFKARRSQEIAA